MTKAIISLLIFFVNMNVYATNYYLSNAGNDHHSGKSPSRSWRTLDRLNNQKLKAGDSVLFKAGDKFIGEVKVRYAGAQKSPIVYGVYGKGSAAELSGAKILDTYTNHTASIRKYQSQEKVYQLFFNNKLQTLARYPNNGILVMDEGFNNKISFSDQALMQTDGYWQNANIRFRTWDWEIRTSLVKEYAQKKITISDSSTNILDKGWGYYFDNKFSELDTVNEWYYDDKNALLYFMPSTSGNSNSYHPEAVIYKTAFSIAYGVNNVVIKGIDIQKYAYYGINAEGNNANVVVEKNSIKNIGITAVNFNIGAQKCLVNNNQIKNIEGRGISALEPAFMIISQNSLSHIGTVPGYGISGVNGMIGIVIENIEERKKVNSHIAHDNLISNNVVDSIGYVAIRMDGANSVLEKNLISNALLHLSDGSAIYTWALDGDYYSYNNIIRNNIIYNIKGSNLGTPSKEDPIANGIYIDNYVYNIRVENNTIFNITGSGIHVNSGAYNNTILSNTIYNANTAMSVAEWLKPKTTFNNLFKNNNILISNSNQHAVSLINWLVPDTKLIGDFEQNNYISYKGGHLFNETYLDAENVKISKDYDFEDWQNIYQADKNSIYRFSNKIPVLQSSMPELIYNYSDVKKSYDFERNHYYDLNGISIKKLDLLPFGSAILFKNKQPK